ncbi:hypothetical protein PIB30_102791 [Stylosanthes scabra]|uniref:Uncharacterized protein n=1 Tax=Stylosanthes scabra TaxID=79078 RepID=A0ABU6UXH6_9FABA|nr:hypothetical protein [Stylosanthes scabra]
MRVRTTVFDSASRLMAHFLITMGTVVLMILWQVCCIYGGRVYVRMASTGMAASDMCTEGFRSPFLRPSLWGINLLQQS